MNISIVLLISVALAMCQGLAYGGDNTKNNGKFWNYLDTKVGKFLEKFRTTMRTGNETLGIPKLDPFQSERYPFNIDEDVAKLNATLTKINVVGASGYEVIEGDFKFAGVKVTVALKWPEIVGKTDYSVNGLIANQFTVFGRGNIDATLKDLYAKVVVGLSIKDKHLYVKSIESHVKLGAIKMKITGLLNDEELSEMMSAIVNDLAPQLIDDYQKELTDIVNQQVSKILNERLSKMTLSDLLGMLN